jgi:hypothetical protein
MRTALQTADAPEPSLLAVQSSLADNLVSGFRSSVLVSSTTLKPLRGAASRAYALLFKDLIYNCDRYDQAFRDFVLTSHGTVEILEDGRQWRADPSWQQHTATFLSLCAGLRHADAGHLADSFVEDAVNLAAGLHGTTMAQLKPMAEAALEVATHRAAFTQSLDRLGLPQGWAGPLATGMGYAASCDTLIDQVYRRISEPGPRQAFSQLLQQAVEQFQEQARQHLRLAYRTFIEGELERIGINLAARNEGAWSLQ